MTVRVEHDGTIHLDGICGIDDAEPLLRHLLAAPAPPVDWNQCERAHTAIIQLLLSFRPPMEGAPQDEFLSQHIAPLLGPSPAGGNALFKA